MKKKELTGRQQRERNILLVMPAVVAPLLTILFWLGGGGKGRAATIEVTGFLKRLPGAYVPPVTRLDKMGYYDLARRDSLMAHQRMAMDKNYARQLHLGPENELPDGHGVAGGHADGDPAVERIQQKLGELRRVVSAGGRSKLPVAPPTPTRERRPPPLGGLERALQALHADAGGDAEMRDLDGVAEKLLSLQRLQKDSGMRSSAAPTVVLGRSASPSVAALGVRSLPQGEDSASGFDSSSIEAVVPETSVLVSGGEIRLELIRDVLIGRQRVPAGTPVYGIGTLNGERLQVMTDAIASEGWLLPVSFKVIDQDGMAGIHIPGTPVTDALRESVSRELSGIGGELPSTQLAGQAVNAGLVLARRMIGKKIRPVKVTIPEGYRVFLKIKNGVL